MRQYCIRGKPWSVPLYMWLWRLRLLFLVLVGCTLADSVPVGAAEQPGKGGTIVWAVHEGMPDFDIHYSGQRFSSLFITP